MSQTIPVIFIHHHEYAGLRDVLALFSEHSEETEKGAQLQLLRRLRGAAEEALEGCRVAPAVAREVRKMLSRCSLKPRQSVTERRSTASKKPSARPIRAVAMRPDPAKQRASLRPQKSGADSNKAPSCRHSSPAGNSNANFTLSSLS